MHFWQITQDVPQSDILLSGPWIFSQMTPDIRHDGSIRHKKKKSLNFVQDSLFLQSSSDMQENKKQNEAFHLISTHLKNNFLMLEGQASGSLLLFHMMQSWII